MSVPDSTAAADCWGEVGVGGDLSCARLTEHMHCRHCPVYREAAGRILERSVDDAYRAQWAERLRQPRLTHDALDGAALVFRVGVEWLAVAATAVVSVVPVAPVHRVPHRSGGALLGVVNVDGRLVAALSLARVLGIDDSETETVTGRHVFARLLVLDCAGQHCAFPVAELQGLVRYASTRLAAPAATINRGLERHLDGVLRHDGLLVGVLDPVLLANHCAGVLR